MIKGFIPWTTSTGERIGWKISEHDYKLMIKTNDELSTAHWVAIQSIRDHNAAIDAVRTQKLIKDCAWYQIKCKKEEYKETGQ